MLSTVMQTLDSTIANVALPYMQGAMSASQEEINWVLTSYIVAAAIMTAPTGFIAARFGRTRVLVASIISFTLASILCGASQSLEEIIFFRIIQGLCGAALVPLSQAILLEIYPPEQRGFSMGLWTAGALAGPILGPTLGGYLTEYLNWRWVFYINVPVGILATIGLLSFSRDTAPRQTAKMDWLGFGALSLGVGALQAMLDRGETLDWFSSREIVIEACLTGVGFYLFIVQTLLAKKPFLSPRLFMDANFVISSTFIFVIGLILYSTLALLAPYVQTLMNYPAGTAGLALAPRGAGSMIVAFSAGWLMRRFSIRAMVACGFSICICMQIIISSWTPDISEWTIVWVGFIQGLGVSGVTVPLTTAAFSTLPPELRGEATSVYSLIRNLGSAIGISVTSALLVSYTQVNHANLVNYVTPFSRNLQHGAPAQYWNPFTAAGAAALNSEITRQATIIAYGNDFKILLYVAVIVLPLVVFIRPPAAALKMRAK